MGDLCHALIKGITKRNLALLVLTCQRSRKVWDKIIYVGVALELLIELYHSAVDAIIIIIFLKPIRRRITVVDVYALLASREYHTID